MTITSENGLEETIEVEIPSEFDDDAGTSITI